jgi:hypothetical protein
MPNPYGRPRTFKRQMNVRLPDSLMAKLFLAYPHMFKPHNPKELKHGEMSDYLTRLVKADLDQQLSPEMQEEIESAIRPDGICPHGKSVQTTCVECSIEGRLW